MPGGGTPGDRRSAGRGQPGVPGVLPEWGRTSPLCFGMSGRGGRGLWGLAEGSAQHPHHLLLNLVLPGTVTSLLLPLFFLRFSIFLSCKSASLFLSLSLSLCLSVSMPISCAMSAPTPSPWDQLPSAPPPQGSHLTPPCCWPRPPPTSSAPSPSASAFPMRMRNSRQWCRRLAAPYWGSAPHGAR